MIQVRLSGFGGQGIVLAGKIFGQAAFYDGKNVAGSNTYGAQSRGSACRADLILSNTFIDFPYLTSPNLLISMSQGSYDLYASQVKEGNTIVFDDLLVKPNRLTQVQQFPIPATSEAVKKLKNKMVANIIILAATTQITQIVSKKAFSKAIDELVPERFKTLNQNALKLGFNLGKKTLPIYFDLRGKGR